MKGESIGRPKVVSLEQYRSNQSANAREQGEKAARDVKAPEEAVKVSLPERREEPRSAKFERLAKAVAEGNYRTPDSKTLAKSLLGL